MVVFETIVSSYQSFLFSCRVIFVFDLFSLILDFVWQHIEPWLSSAEDHERERAVKATAHILAYYLDNLNVKV